MLSFPNILKFFAGVIRAKFIAVYLGTEGAGIISQLNNILSNIAHFTSAGMPDGMVRQLASANSQNAGKKEIVDIIKTFTVTIGVLTVVVYILGYMFSKNLTLYVFGNTNYHDYFLIGFTALPIMILSSSSFAIIKAYKHIKSLMFAEMIIISINLISFTILVYFFQLPGAVIFITLSFLTTSLVYRYIAKKKILKKIGIGLTDIIKADFKGIHFKELLTFMGVILTAGAYEIFVDVTTRSIVVTKLGVEKMGVYSPIIAWAGLFTGFILPSLTTYLFPRMSEVKTNAEISSLVNDVFRLMMFIALPFILIGITTRNYFIPLFYSKEFMEAGLYLPFHFIGIFFTICSFIFAQIFAPTGRLKYFVPIILFNNTLLLALVYFLVPKYALWGWAISFTITPIIASIIYYLFWYKTIHFRFFKENYFLIGFVFIVSLLILLFRNDQFVLTLLTILSLGSAWLLLKKNEQQFILNKIKRYGRFKK